MIADRTSCARSAQITEHRFTKLVDYVKDRLIAKSVALVKWKKARPELFPDSPIRARDVLPGENWIFPDHRTLGGSHRGRTKSGHVVLKGS